MKLDIIIDENTCFYYWVQSLTGWSIHPPEKQSYELYQTALAQAKPEQKHAIQYISKVLRESKDPRNVLAELYTGDMTSRESLEISNASNCLRELFEPVFNRAAPQLQSWKNRLHEASSAISTQELEAIGSFLSTSINMNTPQKVFLIQNPDFASSMGHVIRGTSFMLIHPAGEDVGNRVNKTLSTLLHEYVHLLEFHSKTTEELFKSAYKEFIQPRDLKTPPGFTWRLLYSEVIAYCFANNITGGYFRPLTYGKDRPSTSEMRKGFLKLIEDGKHTTNDVIAWIGLSIMPEVEEYLGQGRAIDSRLANRIAELFLELFVDF